MVYMTFNSSCSYAGVANMLAQYHFAVDDRTIVPIKEFTVAAERYIQLIMKELSNIKPGG